MAINFLNNVDYNQNQLFHPTIENQASDALAGTPVDGQLYYNTGASPGLKVGEGGSWEYVGDNTDTNNYVTGGSISGGTVTLTREGLSDVTFAINNSNITNGANYITAASLPTVNDGTLTVQGTGALGGSGTFTANDADSPTISITHDTFGTAGTYAYPSSVTTNSTGHITAITAGSAPTTPSDATITLVAGDELDGGGDFTLNQAANETITFDLGEGGAGAATYGSTSDSTKIDTITLDAYGRVTAVATGATGQVNTITSGNTSTLTSAGTTTVTLTPVTAAVTNAGTALATGDQIYDFVTSQIATIPSGLSFEGNWNASTDSPDLSAATPDNGQFWIVSVAGSTDLDGITDWKVGDWAIYVSTGAGADGWQKVDNTSTLSGSGAANQVTYWTGTANVAGDAGMTYNASSNALTITGVMTASGGNSTQWNSAYTKTNAFTTVGENFTTLADPSAIRFIRVNADNTVSALDASDFRTAIGAGSGGGSVTEVSLGTLSGISGTVNTATSTPEINLTNTDKGSSQDIFKNVATSSGTAVADTNDDTLTIVGSGGVSTSASGKTITITAAANTNTQLATASALIDVSAMGSNTIASFTHSLASKNLIVQIYDVTTGQLVYADVDHTSINAISVSFGVTPTNDIRVVVIDAKNGLTDKTVTYS